MREYFGRPLTYVRGMGPCRWEYIGGNECRGAVVPRPIEVLIRPVSLFYPQTGRELSPDIPTPPPPPHWGYLDTPTSDPPTWALIAFLAVAMLLVLLEIAR